jgi:hypothetical protein
MRILQGLSQKNRTFFLLAHSAAVPRYVEHIKLFLVGYLSERFKFTTIEFSMYIPGKVTSSGLKQEVERLFKRLNSSTV